MLLVEILHKLIGKETALSFGVDMLQVRIILFIEFLACYGLLRLGRLWSFLNYRRIDYY